MGRRKPNKGATVEKDNGGERKHNELMNTLTDFTSKENWDEFFTIKRNDDAFEWYADWPKLERLVTDQLKEILDSGEAQTAEKMSILVPGCGNSTLSEHLYDAGFENIMNIDFSKVVIKDMLHKNVRVRKNMKWRVMDMTKMEFKNGEFDSVLDKGGLDALMEPKLGTESGYLYLLEVKRILKVRGKYICLTLAEAHVLDLLFLVFRFGWKMSLYAVEAYSKDLKLQTFMVVAEKDSSTAVSDIHLCMDKEKPDSHAHQAKDLHEAIERENKIRLEYSVGSDVQYSLQDLLLGAKGNLVELEPGRRVRVVLGGLEVSRFIYNGILLDAKEGSGPIVYHYGVFLVPQQRASDWLFSTEEGQWLITVSARASRLLMILLDSSNSNISMEYIQMDLSPLVKQLAPGCCDDTVQIPFMAAGDGIKERNIVHQVTSELTGPIVVEDVIYEELNDGNEELSAGCKFRRLTFQRTENLVQSEARLASEPSGTSEVVHNHLASQYHTGIISGILLISSHLKKSTADGVLLNTVVIGLGAGLLPMFMKNFLPSLKIEVVELDPVVLDAAIGYFGFVEDEHLMVHITDGIEFVKDRAEQAVNDGNKIDILVVDVDSADTSSGLTCPAEAFVEESFLLIVHKSLSEKGLLIINLVTRSSIVKENVYSRIKKVFKNIFTLQLEEDINEVVFALKTDFLMNADELLEARREVVKTLLGKEAWKMKVCDLSEKIELVSGAETSAC